MNRVIPPEHLLSTALNDAQTIVSLALSANNDDPASALRAIQATKRALMQSRRWLDAPVQVISKL